MVIIKTRFMHKTKLAGAANAQIELSLALNMEFHNDVNWLANQK